MDNPDIFVSNFMGNSIGLKRVNGSLVTMSCVTEDNFHLSTSADHNEMLFPVHLI